MVPSSQAERILKKQVPTSAKQVFITGGTGYIGSRLVTALLERGHAVTVLARQQSRHRLPAGAHYIAADAFDAGSFQELIPKGAVFVQLLGVSHPSPSKAEEFISVDLASVKASAIAARRAEVSHFIYLSVSMVENRIMKDYQDARKTGEAFCLSLQLSCTFLRPWYVLGPGHRWPILLLPFYGIARLFPKWRQKAKGMSLVTIKQVIRALTKAVESEPRSVRIVEIPEIKNPSSCKTGISLSSYVSPGLEDNVEFDRGTSD